MAETKVIGNDFFLRIDVDGTPAFIVCEQSSELSVSAEIITVLCKNTGEWQEVLAGGLKSGSISATGVYVKNPDSPNLSAFDIIGLIGTIQEAIWGGLEPGDDQVVADVHVTELSISTATNEAITFSLTLTLTGEPTVSQVSS